MTHGGRPVPGIEELAVTVRPMEATLGGLVPGSMLLQKVAYALRDNVFTIRS